MATELVNHLVAQPTHTLVYDAAYNMPSVGPQGLKYQHVFEALPPHLQSAVVAPPALADPALSHTAEYMEALQDPNIIRAILEDPDMSDADAEAVRSAQHWHYSGSLFATQCALRDGFAVNLGGGLHHASREGGGGFCIYNDITACVEWLLSTGAAKRVLIVDLDAHQGNGYETDLQEACRKGQVCVLDAYAPMLFPFPHGEEASESIHYFIPYIKEDRGDIFIPQLLEGLTLALDEFYPDFVIYNAGSDPLEGDPLTGLSQTEEAILDRDYAVVEMCRRAHTPVMMCLSGGYQPRCAEVHAASLCRLLDADKN